MVNRLLNIARARVTGTSEWKALPGMDGHAAIWDVGDRVVKAKTIGAFRASLLVRMLGDVHGALAPARLAPALLASSYDNGVLVMELEKLAPTWSPGPRDVGVALARAHARLASVPVRGSHPWVGFYGEAPELRFLVPLVEDRALREGAQTLLGPAARSGHTEPAHTIHRDLNAGNVVGTPDGLRLLDWDMAHGGHREDDVAMCLLFLADECGVQGIEDRAAAWLAGYRGVIAADWAELGHPVLRSALAVAGLRQAVGGWFADEGHLSAPYWRRIRARLEAACRLVRVGE